MKRLESQVVKGHLICVLTTVRSKAHDYFRRDAERMVELFEQSGAHEARLVDNPSIADFVIFVGSEDRALVDVRSSPVFRAHAHKSFVFHSGDEPIPTVPGIYTSVPKRWYDPSKHRAGFYLRTALDGSFEDYSNTPPTRLFSFVGALANHPVRRRFNTLDWRDGLLVDSGSQIIAPELAKRRYLDSLKCSAFILCPRGAGTSSFRIFETMRAGRVPVIISDQWVEPLGPDWGAFSLRIAEADLASLPALLTDRAQSVAAMGLAARAAWERWFSPNASSGTIIHWLSEINQQQSNSPFQMPKSLRWRYRFQRVKYSLRRVRSTTEKA